SSSSAATAALLYFLLLCYTVPTTINIYTLSLHDALPISHEEQLVGFVIQGILGNADRKGLGAPFAIGPRQTSGSHGKVICSGTAGPRLIPDTDGAGGAGSAGYCHK